MCDVRDAHPWTNDLVTMYTPIHRAPNGANCKDTRCQNDERKRNHHDPLSPFSILHSVIPSWLEFNSAVHASGMSHKGRDPLGPLLVQFARTGFISTAALAR